MAQTSKPPPGAPEHLPPPKQVRVTENGLAPYHRIAKPLTDSEGRIKVIVDFMDTAKDRYLDAAREAIANFDPKRDRHNPQTLLLLDAKSRQYGIEPQFRQTERGERERINVITWVDASLIGYLAPGQIEALRKDEDVRLITEDRVGKFSSNPLWEPSWNGAEWTELNDWGWNAVRGKEAPANGDRVVWIVDSGVAFHSELPSVSERYNVGTGASSGPQTVGCYAHSTHIAGIIGGTSGNNQGRRGIYAGVEMRSINSGIAVRATETGAVDPSLPQCAWQAGGGMSTADLAGALDYVYNRSLLYIPSNPRPNVVNFSGVGSGTGFSSSGVAMTNQTKIQQLVAPIYPWAGTSLWYWYYRRNVFVQSAGNQAVDSCSNLVDLRDGTFGSVAYKPSANATASNASDGVLVVGALGSNGNRQAPFSAAYPIAAAGEPGSNFGGCVDLWAPGNRIYSTWGAGFQSTRADTIYAGSQPAICSSGTCTSPPYSGWAHLSGTSMAAPHVAAAAAYYIDQQGLSTPAQVEAALRNTSQLLLPSGLRMVKLP